MRWIRLTLVAGLLAALAGACGKTGEPAKDQARGEEPATSEAPHWTYEGDTGPTHWGTLSGEWSACGDGQSQSPIDIAETVRATDLPALAASFQPASLKIIHHEHVADGINNGHTIQINCSGGDVLSVGDGRFELAQYHFHSPSEHTVRGQHHAMEMHLVHKSADGKLAVVGVFIEEGAHNAAFDPIWSNLPATKGTETHLENVMVDMDQLLPATLTSYRYDGSLTTPPCSKDVTWIVLATPIQLSAEQIATFRSLIHGNNRPVQPLNGRTVVTDQVAEVDGH